MAVQGYEDIDKLVTEQGRMLDKSLKQQNDIVNRQTQMQVDSLARQKEQIDREATQQNRALYQDYRKASNPFGVQAENLAGQGLANSGYAETTMSRLYNTYQNNITATLNNARQLKNDVDFQIQQARQTGDITLAQNALQLFQQRMQLLSQEYDLRNNREQLLYNRNYQTQRNKIEDERWKQEFKYKKQRDKVADTQWQKEYELSKKARASSSRGGSSRSAGGYSLDDLNINIEDTNNTKNTNKSKTSLDTRLKGLAATLNTVKRSKTLSGVYQAQMRKAIAEAVDSKEINDKQADSLFKKYGL